MQANRQMPKILAFFILVVLCFQFSVFYITKVTDPTPSPSPTREGSAFVIVLPSLQGEGSGVGSVLLLSISAFVLRKSCCKISHFSAIYHRFGQKNGATLIANVAPPINLLKP
jgi:hypothetical protein